ncbi:hypothetical protein BaRGS_00021701, partial [Batillaria attramentaria]
QGPWIPWSRDQRSNILRVLYGVASQLLFWCKVWGGRMASAFDVEWLGQWLSEAK